MNDLISNGFFKLSESECTEIQNELSSKIIHHCPLAFDEIKTVAGVDLAYWNNGAEYAVCCIVIIDITSKTVTEKQWFVDEVKFPYIPGCLAFRELPLVVKAAEKLNQKPDVYMFDGNGILHPRHMGLASHASFYLDAPTVGVAKSYFRVEGASLIMPDNKKGSVSDITKNGEILGRAVRTQKDVKPIYISVGNYMDIDTASRLALTLTDEESHIPIPTRYADLETHKMRSELKNNTKM